MYLVFRAAEWLLKILPIIVVSLNRILHLTLPTECFLNLPDKIIATILRSMKVEKVFY